MPSKLPRSLIGWSVAAWAGTVVALVLQLWVWVVLATRKVSHGSGDYLGHQDAALVLGVVPAFVSLVLAVLVLRRRGRSRSAVVLLVADVACLALVGALVVPAAITVFRFAPTDDAVFAERARLGYFAHGDLGAEFTPDGAQVALQSRVDALARGLGTEVVVPHDDASATNTDRDRPGTSPAGIACTEYAESFVLSSSVDRARAAAYVSSVWAKQSAAGKGTVTDGQRSLVFAPRSGGSVEYRPEDRTFVTRTACLIGEPARPMGG
ncbi:hypothetical protein [Curtobacterium sp. 9128]|uniref:hypothetical protein n=1 Tax=Curtobacterium sp. 9128 TaxID=1793722 RepID=UPI0011A479BE|nr:hypothetical protein [Curtobacterium sp. 9128]